MAKSFKTGITADGTVSATSLAVTGEFTLPTADGSADQVLVTNGSGTITWSDQSGGGFTVSDTAPGSPSAGDLWFESDTGKTFVYYNDGSSSQWVEVGAASAAASGNDGAVQFSSGGALSSDTTNFYWDDTNNRLGIGTTSPAEELHILKDQDGDLTQVLIENLDQRLRIGSYYEAGVAQYSKIQSEQDNGNNVALALNPEGGNVGIGTTSPETPLNIVTTNKIGATFTGTTDGEGLRVDQSNYTAGNYVSLVEGSYDDGATEPHVRIGAMYDGSGSNLAFGTSNSYVSGITNTAMFIASSGNVGIGTTTPERALHVNSGTTNTSALFESTDANVRIYMQDSGSTDAEQVGFLGISDDLRLVAGGGARLTIQSDGKVGIGTTSPSTTLDVNGSLSKNSGSFKIAHPLPAMAETHNLVHSFVEAPQADNLYRGRVALVDGAATVDLDEAAGMTDGTFELLNRDLQCFIVNNQGWTAVRGSVSGSTLTIEAQDASCTDTVDWLVIGERHDQHMYDTEWTDDDGRVIVEPLRPVEPEALEAE